MAHFQTLSDERLSPEEKVTLLERWNATDRPFPENEFVHDLIERQIRENPQHTSVISHYDVWSYRELGEAIDGCWELLVAKGVRTGSVVAVLVSRRPMMIALLIAVMRAGGAYLPLNTQDPLERRQLLLQAADVLVEETDHNHLEVTHLRVDGHTALTDRSPQTLPCYVMYTSGSTGRPKAVVVSHESLVCILFAMWERLLMSPKDRVLASTTTTFDISLVELLLPLICGATVVLATEEEARDPFKIADLSTRQRVSVIQATPTMWFPLLKVPDWYPSLRVAVCGGEVFPEDLVERFIKLRCPVMNAYGPTEATIWATTYDVSFTSSLRPCIGRPLANVRVYVADDSMKLVPIGNTGELYIGGRGVALGYLDDEHLTSERFVRDPFVEGRVSRLYRTGDRARWNEHGCLEYQGRSDRQTKIRGMRIEPEEIEARLRRYPQVVDAAVASEIGEDSSNTLVAYLVLEGSAKAPPHYSSELRDYLRTCLPEQMVPSYYRQVNTIPASASGKRDRVRLSDQFRAGFALPDNSTALSLSDTLSRIWCDLLRIPIVDIDDDFFSIGGHSLLAIEVSLEIMDRLCVRLGLEDIVAFPTIRQLTAHLEQLRSDCQDP